VLLLFYISSMFLKSFLYYLHLSALSTAKAFRSKMAILYMVEK